MIKEVKVSRKMYSFLNREKKIFRIFITIFCIAIFLTSYFVSTTIYPESNESPFFSYFTNLMCLGVTIYYLFWFLGDVVKISFFKYMFENKYLKLGIILISSITFWVYWIILFIPILIGQIKEFENPEQQPIYVWFLISFSFHFIVPILNWFDFKSTSYKSEVEFKKTIYLSLIFVFYIMGILISVMYVKSAPYPFLNYIEYPILTSIMCAIAIPIVVLVIKIETKKYNQNVNLIF